MMVLGYPSRLKGEEIPFLARIAAIADSFDAMTSRRVYRDSLNITDVINEFKRFKGTQFDPNITDTFLTILENNFDEVQEIMNFKV